MSMLTGSQNRVYHRTSPAKRRRESNIFVEYEPPKYPAKKKAASTAQKVNSSTKNLLSCGECRRLKLKCDRVFPCHACIRRGCQGICPNGSLVSGKGTRFVLASTEQLHDKITQMSARIGELEAALHGLYLEHYRCPIRSGHGEAVGRKDRDSGPPTHPLLQGDKLLVKHHLELYGEVERTPSTKSTSKSPSPREAVQSPNLPQEARVEEASVSGTESRSDSAASPATTLSSSPRSTEIPVDQQIIPSSSNSSSSTTAKLSLSYLAVWLKVVNGGLGAQLPLIRSEVLDIARAEIIQKLPPRRTAERLCNIVQQSGFYIFNYLLTSSQLMGIIDDVYNNRIVSVNVALLFVLIGIGTHMECFAPKIFDDGTASSEAQSIDYITISRAAITLQALDAELQCPKELEPRAIHYHYFLLQYLSRLSSRKPDKQQLKDIMNVLISMAKSAELHIESSYLKYDANEQYERRMLFYEILGTTGDFNLALDQPEAFASDEICQPPSCSKAIERFPTQLEAFYYECKHSFYANCFKPLLAACSKPVSSSVYTDILELDCKIRTFPYPAAVLQDIEPDPNELPGISPSAPRLKLLRFIAIYRINSLLLHLHRKFLQECLCTVDSILAHPYFASVIATSRSAWVLIRNIDSMHREYPDFVNMLTVPWYNVFCAASALFIMTQRIPYCPVTPYSIRELIRATGVFERAAAMHSPMAKRSAPLVGQYVVKGTDSLRRWKEKLVPAFSEQPLLNSRLAFCTARFEAILNRIKGLPVDVADKRVTEGLEIWDVVHPDISELLMKFPGCIISRDTPDDILWNTVYAPLSDENASDFASRSTQTPLVEFFDALDFLLRRCPEFLSPAQLPDLQSSCDAANTALREMFPDNLEFDWAALTDALVSAPAELMRDAPCSGWNGQWEWRGSLPHVDVDTTVSSWNTQGYGQTWETWTVS